MPRSLTRIAAVLLDSPWAIQESWLQEMYAIFRAHQTDGALANSLAFKGILQKDEDSDEDANYRLHRGVYRRGPVAVIPVRGPIFPRANLMTKYCGATSLELVTADVLAAEMDPDVKHIVFPSDSPGGVVTGVDEFGAVLRQLTKPTYGHVSGMGASAMYWILSQMTQISISPTSAVGSLGVVMSMTKYRKAGAEEYPKELQFVSSISPKKRLDPESKEGETEILSMVNSIAEVFAKEVAAGRKVSLETVLERFGQGGMITGEAAVAAGMVDRVDTLEALLDRLEKEETTSYSSYGDYQMKKAEYKDKFPGEYEAIRAEGAAEVSANLTSATTKIVLLEQDNSQLKSQLDKAAEINAANDARLKALEKDKAIALEKANQVQAEGVFSEVFKASGIPGRLEDKVRRTCATSESFTKDGVFDAEGYKASISAEVGDWAKELGAKAEEEPVLKGLGAKGNEDTDDLTKVDATVDALLAFVSPAAAV